HTHKLTIFPYTTLFRSPKGSALTAVSQRLSGASFRHAKIQKRSQGGTATPRSAAAERTSRRATQPSWIRKQDRKRIQTLTTCSRSEEHTSELQSPDHLV